MPKHVLVVLQLMTKRAELISHPMAHSAPVLRQGGACVRRAVPKERMSPETCPYLTLSTNVATGH